MTLIFNLANFFVLPFWALMIFLPNWGVTKRVMESFLPLVLLALVYIYFFVNVNPESLAALSSTELGALARGFSDEKVMATGWTHYLVMDLFVGRWIYWEGQKTGVWTIHSLILGLFAGPIGLLSHLITVGVRKRFFSSSCSETTITTASNESEI
jgi:hypothetical protein